MKDKQITESELYESRFPFIGRYRFVIWLLSVILAIVSALWVTTGVRAGWYEAIGGVQVSGKSMMETLQDGDKLLVAKTGWWHQADYGDVIIVQVDGYEEWQGKGTKFIIKRLIAKEGDSVFCQAGTVYLKKSWESEYTKLNEPYAYYGDGGAKDKDDYHFASRAYPYVVGEGEIFFLGDNRFNSEDSRYKEGGSKLHGRLYRSEDIYGTVPNWAIEYRTKIESWLFR
ncbi:MAG: signal peptidase I [Clostridia bacterium]|nr:signal peptidase I [Clostridia bacterium]